MHTHSRASRVRGSLFGLAFGDALARPTEFMAVEDILHRWPSGGPEEMTPQTAVVTDDTQMALAVGQALIDTIAAGAMTPATFEQALRRRFVQWLQDPDNDRAPGNTCIQACTALGMGHQWLDATIHSSKGCGANMRVTPIALLPDSLPDMSPTLRSALAQFQAAITHGHPTALAASDLTAFATKYLLDGGGLDSILPALREHAATGRRRYHHEWLGALWQRPGMLSPEEFIERGWDECLAVLDRVDAAIASPDYETDPCKLTGAGWVAEEAFSTGLYCFLLYPDDPPAAIRRAAVTSGDSDSIAALTGAFAGAHCGSEGWPEEWYYIIEYNDRLTTQGAAFSSE